MNGFEQQRRQMVRHQLQTRDISDPAVLSALASIPRERFIPADLAHLAYSDGPLSIGHGQTISQPYIVAYMTQALALRPGDRVLEVGTGSGYQAAVLSQLAQQVYSIEYLQELYLRTAKVIQDLKYNNIKLRHGNGRQGWPEAAPFDKIMVTAAADKIPSALIDQLASPGRLIAPVASQAYGQELILIVKNSSGRLQQQTLLPVVFVPLK